MKTGLSFIRASAQTRFSLLHVRRACLPLFYENCLSSDGCGEGGGGGVEVGVGVGVTVGVWVGSGVLVGVCVGVGVRVGRGV